MTETAHRHAPDAVRPDRAAASLRRVDADALSPSGTPMELGILDLQGSIGNRAVRDLLMVQRDATTDTITAGARSTPSDPAATGSALTPDQRIELRRLTGNRISRAFTAFAQACEQNRAAIKAAAANSSDFTELLLEIVLGRLLPGDSKGISNLAQDLPASASSASYRLALAAMNEERTTALLETGVKFGREYMKGESALEGEDEIDEFLNTLEDLFHKGADEIDKNLPNLSDEALGVTCAAYDPTVAGLAQFRASVRILVQRYERQVKPIGTTEYHWMNRQSDFSLYWVVSPTGNRRLALMENDDLKEWIAPELQSIAIQKFASTPAGRYWKGQVPEIPANRVGNLSG